MTDDITVASSNDNFPEKRESREIKVEFIGSPKEYWKIYMINLALTLLTFGLYRPWAKVRQYKYLYNHLLIDGIPMNFTAKPTRLLIGQLIVMAFIGLYLYADLTRNMFLTGLLILMFVLLLPMLMWFSYRFFFRYTQWSGVSMSFAASKTEFYIETLITSLISLFVITIPFAQKRWFEFIGRNVFWGSKRLSVKPSLEKLYTGFGIYLAVFIGALFLFMVWIFIVALVIADANGNAPEGAVVASILGWMFLGVFIYLTLFMIGYSFFRGYTIHAIYHGLKIGNAKLKLKVGPIKLSKEFAKMYLLTLLSLGFAYPYLFAKFLSLIANNAYIVVPEGETLLTRDVSKGEVSAIGAEALDDVGFDVDFDIGL